MHEAAYTFVQQALSRVVVPPGPVLEIGGRNINGTVRPLFEDRPYASVDLRDGPGVDLVGDVCDLDPIRTAQSLFRKPRVACVVCCEVLEHAEDGRGICQWAAKILGPRGVFLVTAANPLRFSHSGIDGGNLHPGEYYQGVSASMLNSWLKPFRFVEIQEQGADIYAVAIKAKP